MRLTFDALGSRIGIDWIFLNSLSDVQAITLKLVVSGSSKGEQGDRIVGEKIEKLRVKSARLLRQTRSEMSVAYIART